MTDVYQTPFKLYYPLLPPDVYPLAPLVNPMPSLSCFSNSSHVFPTDSFSRREPLHVGDNFSTDFGFILGVPTAKSPHCTTITTVQVNGSIYA